MINLNAMTTKLLTYSELISLPTFEERFEYCKLPGKVGNETFGGSRYLNQILYTLPMYREWRRKIVIRDLGCDLACSDRQIVGKIVVHHLNPLTISDVKNRSECCMDPENVICVSYETHNAIHYGDKNLLVLDPIIRTPNDTIPWRM